MQNIANTKEYLNLEFIILDYNSKDETDYWIKENLGDYIAKGTVCYYKTFETVREPGHSKNIICKLAEGDIVCKIGASDQILPDFCNNVNSAFTKNDAIILVAKPEIKSRMFCLLKRDFLTIHGFDERIDQEEFDEIDLINRLRMMNINQISIEGPYSMDDHIEDEKDSSASDDLYKVFIAYHTPSSSELIILYNDQHYKKGIVINNAAVDSANYKRAGKKDVIDPEYGVKASDWETGLWRETGNESILFTPKYNDEYIFLKGHYPYSVLLDVSNDLIFLSIAENEIIKKLFSDDPAFYSKAVIKENLDNKILMVNTHDFGKAIVFKNFNWDSPVLV